MTCVVLVCSDSADDDDQEDTGGSRATPVDDVDVTELSRSHSLPSHILHLRLHDADRDVVSRRPAAVSVHSISTVLRGSQFGPFSCHVDTSSTHDSAPSDDDCRLEARQ